MTERNVCPKVILYIAMILITLFLFSPGTNAVDYPDMPVINDATCWKCHPTFVSVVDGPYSITPVLGGQHTQPAACNNCHTTKIFGSPRFRECTYCHYDNTPSGYPKYMSYRHTSDGAVAFRNIVNRRHSISNIHQAAVPGCDNCHSSILTDEHNRTDRTDDKGDRINCDTCHTAVQLGNEISTDQRLKIVKTQNYQVQYSDIWYPPTGTVSRVYIDTVLDSSSYMELYALYNGKWGLVYGRSSGKVAKWVDLPAPTTALRTKIHSPYATTLTNSYLDVPKVILSPGGGKYNKINRAVRADNSNCTGCHYEAHNINFSDSIPEDIPLFDGFTWTDPIEASFFAREPFAPSGYENGQVIMSNRRSDISVNDILRFYEDSLSAGGWTRNPAIGTSGNQFFEIEYQKNTRSINIRCFNTEFSNGTGNIVSNGFRLEIWYKY